MKITRRQLRQIIREEAAGSEILTAEEINVLMEECDNAKQTVIDAIDILDDYTKLDPLLLNLGKRTPRAPYADLRKSDDFNDRFHEIQASLRTLLDELRFNTVQLRTKLDTIERLK